MIEEESLRFNAGTNPNPEARERTRLFNMIPTSLNREDRLAVMVHLLGVLRSKGRLLARDDSALQGMLPEFSANEINNARERAQKALQEERNALGDVIRSMEAMMSKKRETLVGAEKREPRAEDIVGLVQKHFNVDLSREKMTYNTQGKSARMAAVFLARRVLRKTVEETASLLGISPYTVGDLAIDGNQEYEAQLSFYKKIRNICREAGIPLPR